MGALSLAAACALWSWAHRRLRGQLEHNCLESGMTPAEAKVRARELVFEVWMRRPKTVSGSSSLKRLLSDL
jgi:hypothetical protein